MNLFTNKTNLKIILSLIITFFVIRIPFALGQELDSYKESLKNTIFSECKDGDNFICGENLKILFSSQIDNKEIIDKRLTNILVICDTTESFGDVNCNENSVQIKNGDLYILDKEKNLKIYYNFDLNNNNFIVIAPENILVFDDSKNSLITFLRDLTVNYRDYSNTIEVTNPENYKLTLLSWPIVELLYAGGLIYLLYILLKESLKTVFRKPGKLLTLDPYIKILTKISIFFKKYRHFPIFTLIFSLAAYFYSLMLISILDLSRLDFGYMLTYVSTTFEYSEILNYIQMHSQGKLIFIFANITVFFLIFVAILPEIINTIIKFLTTLRNKKINQQFIVVSSIFTLLALCATVVNLQLAAFFTASTIAITIMSKNKVRLNLNHKQKNIIFVSLVLFLTLVTIFNIRKSLISKKVVSEVNFKDDLEYVILPLTIDLKNNPILETIPLDLSDKVFANDFLIFDPLYTTIINEPLNKFSKSEKNYSLVFSDLGNFVYALNTNSYIQNLFKSQQVSNILEFRKNDNSIYSLKMRVDCNKILPIKTDLSMYYIDSEAAKEKRLTSFKFIECSNNSSKTYLYNFNTEGVPGDIIFLSLSRKPESLISLSIETKSKEVESTYYKYPDYGYFENKSPETKSIVNYSPTINKENIFYLSEKDYTELFANLNFLLTNNLIKNKLILWSPQTNLIKLYSK